jgi:hypothetical protein
METTAPALQAQVEASTESHQRLQASAKMLQHVSSHIQSLPEQPVHFRTRVQAMLVGPATEVRATPTASAAVQLFVDRVT